MRFHSKESKWCYFRCGTSCKLVQSQKLFFFHRVGVNDLFFVLLTFCPGPSVRISLCSTVLVRCPSKLCEWPPCGTCWSSCCCCCCCTCLERSLRNWRQCQVISWLPFQHSSGEIFVFYLRWQPVAIMPVKQRGKDKHFGWKSRKSSIIPPVFHLLTKLSCHLSATELRKGWSQHRVDVRVQKWLTYLPFKMITTVLIVGISTAGILPYNCLREMAGISWALGCSFLDVSVISFVQS